MDLDSSNLCCSRTHCNYTAITPKEWPRKSRLQMGLWENIFLYPHIPFQHLTVNHTIFYSKASQKTLLLPPFFQHILSLPHQSCPYLLAPELLTSKGLMYMQFVSSQSPSPLSSKPHCATGHTPPSRSILFLCIADILCSSLCHHHHLCWLILSSWHLCIRAPQRPVHRPLL